MWSFISFFQNRNWNSLDLRIPYLYRTSNSETLGYIYFLNKNSIFRNFQFQVYINHAQVVLYILSMFFLYVLPIRDLIPFLGKKFYLWPHLYEWRLSKIVFMKGKLYLEFLCVISLNYLYKMSWFDIISCFLEKKQHFFL